MLIQVMLKRFEQLIHIVTIEDIQCTFSFLIYCFVGNNLCPILDKYLDLFYEQINYSLHFCHFPFGTSCKNI